MPGIVVCFSSLPGCGVPSIDGAGASLSLGAALSAGAGCSAAGGRCHFGRTLYHGGIRLGRGGLILHRGSSFDRLYFSRLRGIVYLPGVRNILFIVSHLKTSFVVK